MSELRAAGRVEGWHHAGLTDAVLVTLTLIGAAPVMAQSHSGSWRDAVQKLRISPPIRSGVGGTKMAVRSSGERVATTAAATIAESEPNDSVETADSVALGDRATGTVDPAGDVDTWSVDLVAGQFFSADVDAAEADSPLDPTLALIGPDGKTLIAFNDDFDGLDSRISYRVPLTGRYYVVVRGFGTTGGADFIYAVNFGKVTCTGSGTEREPNDAPDTATPTSIGASESGELCALDVNPAGDVDDWAFGARAGTTVEIDFDGTGVTTLADPFIVLYASDGITQIAFAADGFFSRLKYSFTSTGTYYVAVASLADPDGNPFPYMLRIRAVAPGPGDPISVRAQNLGFPLGIAVGGTGDVFVGDVTGNRVLRVSPQDVVSTFATAIPSPLGIAFDAFDNLLVASGDGAVYRVTPEGHPTPFLTDAGAPFWIAVASDGRIWLTDVSDGSLRRYSPTGEFEAGFDAGMVGGLGPGPLALGPSGQPYFSQGLEIWKLENGQLQRVLSGALAIWAFAFDVTGNIYLPAPVAGRIVLFDHAGTLVADPFAVGTDAAQAVAFGRDATGATVARLLATDPQVGRLIEVNPAGVKDPGLPVGYGPRTLTLDMAAASLLGAGLLSAADVQFLDALGNDNGRYDVGDFRAYLATVGGAPDASDPDHRPGRIP